jgi:hypothetical protein
MSTAAQQNAMTLASLLGVGEAEAAKKLARTVLITAEPGWNTRWAMEIADLLGRTLAVAHDPGPAAPDLELVLGRAAPRSKAKTLFADVDADGLVVDEAPLRRGAVAGAPHGLFAAAAACAVTAAAVRQAIGDPALPAVRLPMRLRFAELGAPLELLARGVELDEAVMAGAGAVAHGFLRAARHVPLRGALTVVDPKTVAGGILNRCLYLTQEDITHDKAESLTRRAQGDFLSLRLEPKVADFRDYVRSLARPPRTVFVTVDSRAVRRAIQLEVPHRIIDASTTDVRGVVVHSNTLPTAHACLACVYRHVPEEDLRERIIAEGLGLDVETVRKGFIDDAAAARILVARPGRGLTVEGLRGLAFDSLYRQLCAEQALATPEGRQVLAPFAFVSAWAGVLMTVEMLRAFAGGTSTNYWSVDPWNVPIARGRTLKGKHSGCAFCRNPALPAVIEELWGSLTG